MRSQLYYLCLLAVYAAASPLHKILPETPAVPKANIILRKDGRMHGQPAKRATTSTKGNVQLASSRGMESSVDGCDDEHETSSSSRSVTVKVVPVTATKTKTVDVTAVTTTSRTNTKYSTSTATKTVTKNVQLGATPPKTTSKATSKPTTTSKQSTTKVSAPATTTLSTLVTPIPTSSNYVFAGMASYFYTGLGACGWWSADTDMVVALPDHVYDNYPGATPWWDTNGNPVCGKQILATWGTQTIQVTVVDRCVGCETYQLDMSPTAFAALTDGNLDMGLARGLTWRWL